VKGHVIISHGLQSSPEATKATAIARVAQSLGWTAEIPDYRDLDAASELGDVLSRIERLRRAGARNCRGRQDAGSDRSPAGGRTPLVLAGSSMGAFISARVSLAVDVQGLFLMAPPTQLKGYDITLEAAPVPTRIVHGWHDELIPAGEVVRWAQARSDHLILVNDSHRLADHVEFCAQEFGRFVQALS
jgi:predicted alpha/beta-hydrolase family hydrolase